MFEAIILGIVQGITEFLPISSTAHLVLLPRLFGWEDALLSSLPFDVALHVGTLLSVLVCLYEDILDILRSNRRLAYLIVGATVPAGLAGVFLNDYVGGVFRSPALIAVMLVLFGIVMYLAERFKQHKSMKKLTWGDAIFIGFAQALALMPGVSRAGITISAGLARGVKREEAARFSFLLSIPVIAGAAVLEGRHLFNGNVETDFALVGAGFLASFVTGVGAIKFLIKYLAKFSLNAFVYYRFILAGVIIGWLWLGG
jgi:undecaprenyl-diphosphatase